MLADAQRGDAVNDAYVSGDMQRVDVDAASGAYASYDAIPSQETTSDYVIGEMQMH